MIGLGTQRPAAYDVCGFGTGFGCGQAFVPGLGGARIVINAVSEPYDGRDNCHRMFHPECLPSAAKPVSPPLRLISDKQEGEIRERSWAGSRR